MKYKDYVTLSLKEYEILQYNYNKTFIQRKDDLYEIITKLNEQKNALLNSPNREYSTIVPKLQESITHLQKIAQSSHFLTPQSTAHKSTHHENDIAIPPIKNLKKNSQPISGILSNIFKNLNLKNTNISNLKYQTTNIPNMKYHTIVLNDSDVSATCHSHQHNCYRQLDILRLLLLYMTLRPTCPYIHTITRIASEQLDVYMTMLNM